LYHISCHTTPWSSYHKFSPRKAYQNLREEFIGWLFVHPNAFRRGIGRALLFSAIREIAGEPYLWTMRENESAIRLYTSAGFQIEEHRQTQNRGMQCNAVKMKRRKAA